MHYPPYDPQSAVTPLSAAELDALDALLQRLPADGAMTLDGADGYLTALAIGPPALRAGFATGDWLPLVWGGDPEPGPDGAAPFFSKRQRKDTVVLLLRHLRHLMEQFATAPDAWEPVFSIAEQGGREWVDARDWCTGFLQAVDLQPAAWGRTWDDPALAPTLAPLLMLGGGLQGAAATPATPDDAQAVDALSRAVPDAVLRLAAGR